MSENLRVSSPSRSWALLVAVLALIAYGSLYPFQFFPAYPGFPYQAWQQMAFLRPSKGDLVANLLLYLPLGGLVAVLLVSRRHAAAIAAAATLGAFLSAAIETLQWLEPARVSSMTDIALNTIGACCGAVAVRAYAALGRSWTLPGLMTARPPLVPTAVIAAWLLYRWAPYVPTIDWQKYKDALKPLLTMADISVLSVLRYAAGWLVVAYALRFVVQPAWRWRVALLLVGATLVAQIVVVDKVLRPGEIIALVLVAAAAFGLQSMRDSSRAVALAGLMALVVAVEGLRPFVFSTVPVGFSWIPFRVSLSSSADNNAIVLLEKGFRYGALLWLLGRAGSSSWVSIGMVAILVGGLEVLQRWLPGRIAEITDVALVVLLGALLAMVGQTEAEQGRT